MKNIFNFVLVGTLILAFVGLLYGPYIHSPTFFDDIYFFIDPKPIADYVSKFGIFDRRWISTVSFGLTYRIWGADPEAYRVGSLLLHAMVSFSLFIFLGDLLSQKNKKEGQLTAAICAVLFALHPVAVFAAGYITERSIQLAALFSLWMWIAVHRGIAKNQRGWLVLSCVFYYCAVFSKEHSITALPVALLVAWHASDSDIRKTLSRTWMPLLLWCLIALAIILRMRGIIGSSYEPIIGEMANPTEDTNGADFFARSVVNQAYLYFKYALLWMLPYENWMSLDMREPFPSKWYELPWIIGVACYLAYPVIVVWLLRLKRISPTLLVGLLAPWLLFITQFSAVQYQESFVLYRSYLWALPATLVPALLLEKAEKRVRYAVLVVLGVLFFGLSWSRLQTFSNPFLIFDEAVQRLNGNDKLPGAYRIYHNRGLEYVHLGEYDKALKDFNTVITLNPTYPFVYNDRGYVFYKQQLYQPALDDFNRVIKIKPNIPRPYVGMGLTLMAMGRREDGLISLAHACELGYGCPVYRDALNQGTAKIH
jgi:protein O-mannosyl-transferase